MPAVSKSQKTSSCMALAMMDKKIPMKPGPAMEMTKSMTRQQLMDMCGTTEAAPVKK